MRALNRRHFERGESASARANTSRTVPLAKSLAPIFWKMRHERSVATANGMTRLGAIVGRAVVGAALDGATVDGAALGAYDGASVLGDALGRRLGAALGASVGP